MWGWHNRLQPTTIQPGWGSLHPTASLGWRKAIYTGRFYNSTKQRHMWRYERWLLVSIHGRWSFKSVFQSWWIISWWCRLPKWNDRIQLRLLCTHPWRKQLQSQSSRGSEWRRRTDLYRALHGIRAKKRPAFSHVVFVSVKAEAIPCSSVLPIFLYMCYEVFSKMFHI